MKGSTLVDALASNALATGLFETVNGHQPESVPTTGLTCGIWVQDIRPAPGASGLSETTVDVIFNVRIYTSAVQQPYDAIDPNMIDAAFTLCASYSADFTLDGVVMAVDLLGAYGPEMGGQAGYVKQNDSTILRVMTITLPLLIDDLWEQVASS
jgi:hypothetical protein